MHPLRITIVGMFLVQLATGVVLMTAYSPSTASAWGSVWYIQTQLESGWFIRGIHHFASDAMLILLAVAIVQALITRAYEGRGWRLWWALLIGLVLTLALSLTGQLLPWDQEGFWGTTVRTNILAKTPYIGDKLRRLLLGGNELGELTLTRFHTLHVIILPLSLVLLGRFKKQSGERKRPDDSGADPIVAPPLVGGASLLAVVMLCIGLAVYFACHVGGDALLDAPADRTATDYPARPEWHTIFLYQWLKYFQGPGAEVVGAIVIPSIVALVFFGLPAFRRVLPERFAHRTAISLAGLVALGAIVLTSVSLWHDRNPSDKAVADVRTKQAAGTKLTGGDEAVLRARQFNTQRAQAIAAARRAMELAGAQGIPPAGPLAMIVADPMSRGPKLFAANCASCHRYDGHNGLGEVPTDAPTSSDLKGFASDKWIRGFLENPMGDRYFGLMRTPEGEPAHTRMQRFVKERFEGAGDSNRAMVLAEFDAVAAFLSDPDRENKMARLESGELDQRFVDGHDLFMTVCNQCHTYGGERSGSTRAPELKDYGSVEWLKLMIAEPDHETRYRASGLGKARMPRFQEKLSEQEISAIAEWVRNDR